MRDHILVVCALHKVYKEETRQTLPSKVPLRLLLAGSEGTSVGNLPIVVLLATMV